MYVYRMKNALPNATTFRLGFALLSLVLIGVPWIELFAEWIGVDVMAPARGRLLY